MLSKAELKTSVTLSVVISVVINVMVLSISFVLNNPSKPTLIFPQEENKPLNPVVRTWQKRGYDGRDGRDGATGSRGAIGATGQAGGYDSDGSDGVPGLRGQPGVDGLEGRDGEGGRGANIGSTGGAGNQRTDSHSAAVHSIFVRWGRRTCPSNGAGVTAIARAYGKAVVINHGSASSDMLCLMYDNDISSNAFSSGPSATSVVIKNGIQHYELPCALCYCTNNVVVTFTGWKDCPAGESGWSMIYKGWIMTGNGASARSLSGAHCIDESLETRYPSSSASTAFTLVRASKSYKKIPCVVCGRS